MHRIAAPALFLLRIDAGKAVETPLYRAEQPVQRGGSSFVQREEPESHRLCQRDQNAGEGENEKPSFHRHDGLPLKAFRPREHGDEIDEKADRGDAREP